MRAGSHGLGSRGHGAGQLPKAGKGRARRFALVVAAVAALHGEAAAAPAAAAGPQTAATVLILYDGPSAPVDEGFLDAHLIQNLLGHFELSAEIAHVSEYKPGRLANHRAGFFAGTMTGTVFPRAFLEDVRASTAPFCWIGRHIGQLVNARAAKGSYGFRYVDYRDDLEFRQVLYKGATLPKEDPDLNIVAITNPSLAQSPATAVNDEGVRRPYVVRQGRFWYFADSPFSYVQEGDRYLVFCDLLHDILEIPHSSSATALVRIEDVSAESDPADLLAIAGALEARRVPYQVALTPVYRNPSRGFEVRLSDRPFLLDALRAMIGRGAVPVMHGVTHQYRGVTGDDYEFWDDAGNRPVTGDSPEFVLRRVEMGLEECFAAGIFPLAFETPHYAASETGYRTLKDVFRLFYDRTMTTPDIRSIQFFPYPVTDRFGRRVVPENLGYLPSDDPDPKVILERARNLKVIRDGVASFYFHSFLDPALLAKVVDGIASLGYRFVSLRDSGGGLDCRGRFVVRTSPGAARLTLSDEFWRLRLYRADGVLTRQETSRERARGTVEMAVKPPPEGWAALDCLRERPADGGSPSWTARLAEWWSRIRPSRRRLGAAGLFSAPGEAWVLWTGGSDAGSARNQSSYVAALEATGYQARSVPLEQFRQGPAASESVLAIPRAAGERLTPAQREAALAYLSKGGTVIADGRQEWLSRLGFRWAGRSIVVSGVADVLYPDVPLEWKPEETVERFTPPEGSQAFMVDARSGQALALAGRHGEGRYIHLAAPLDDHTPDATSHYPYFADYLAESLGLRMSLRAPRLEAYFDPGYREGANFDRLASSWRQAGIRVIYAAAWQFYPHYAFDYGKLLKACHRHGIPVYAWFVFPATTPKMWQEHPEWRERTASGADGRVGWRYSMNFEDPACFRASMDWMREILAAYAWDGVNITELNYDADFQNYLRADKFVPMNDAVRARFRKQAGFDPALLFSAGSPYHHQRNPGALEQFLRYREDIVTAWHRRVLGELEPLRRRNGWEVVVTALDSLHSVYVRPALGVDSRRIAALMTEFDFTLQVEDPAEHWTGPPDRYRRFAEAYSKLVPDRRRLMFDVNVVPNRSVDGTPLPSSLVTGMELARTVAAAASVSGRAAIYAEHTVRSQDWPLIGAALARPARLTLSGETWHSESGAPLLLATAEQRDFHLDGNLWPAVSAEGVLVPAGKHSLTAERPWLRLTGSGGNQPRLMHIGADLLEAHATPTRVMFRYSSPGRAVAVVDREPLEMLIDGSRPSTPPAAEGNVYYVRLPRGEHAVELVTATRAGVLLDRWGWLSASGIALFGGLTTTAMLLIYLRLRMRRRRRAGGGA